MNQLLQRKAITWMCNPLNLLLLLLLLPTRNLKDLKHRYNIILSKSSLSFHLILRNCNKYYTQKSRACLTSMAYLNLIHCSKLHSHWNSLQSTLHPSSRLMNQDMIQKDISKTLLNTNNKKCSPSNQWKLLLTLLNSNCKSSRSGNGMRSSSWNNSSCNSSRSSNNSSRNNQNLVYLSHGKTNWEYNLMSFLHSNSLINVNLLILRKKNPINLTSSTTKHLKSKKDSSLKQEGHNQTANSSLISIKKKSKVAIKNNMKRNNCFTNKMFCNSSNINNKRSTLM